MSAARASLDAFSLDVHRLLSALDSNVDAETLLQLSEQSRTSFGALEAALGVASARERAAIESELADLRRRTALAEESSRRQRTSLEERLSEVRRARQALAHLDADTTGESCDVAG